MMKLETINRKKELINKLKEYGDNGVFSIYKDAIAKLEHIVNYYENKAKEIHYTLQDCYDKNEKQKFKNLLWLLCSDRKITDHEKNELLEVVNNWNYYKNNFPNGKIMYGYLGF